MSRLELFSRPLVAFDPSNPDHRGYYYEFVTKSSWGSCPVRFVVPEDHGDLVTMIQRSLIKYYVDREFGADAKIRPKLVAQKAKKTVDKRVKR